MINSLVEVSIYKTYSEDLQTASFSNSLIFHQQYIWSETPPSLCLLGRLQHLLSCNCYSLFCSILFPCLDGCLYISTLHPKSNKSVEKCWIYCYCLAYWISNFILKFYIIVFLYGLVMCDLEIVN